MKKSIKRTILPAALVLLTINFQANAQVREIKNVAIFLYQGVELLDFAGPGEVFSTAGFNTYTVSVDGNEVISQRFVTIKPQYSVQNAPLPDIIVFPGGGAEASSKDERVLAWIKQQQQSETYFMSVCTGAAILAKANLLNGMNVTTHYSFINGLQEQLPQSKVLTNTRFVDNNMVITTAGVSAGIDGALHLVARIKGLDAAKQAARYMEYDKWDPQNGRVDKKNIYLKSLQEKSSNFTKEIKDELPPATKMAPYPFEGELLNLSSELSEKKLPEKASNVLKVTITLYPNSTDAYMKLADINRKFGRPAPVKEEDFLSLINKGKVSEALVLYDKQSKSFPGWKFFTEDHLNIAGYNLLAKKDHENAIRVFTLNTKAYPESFNVYDSLGEAYLAAGQKDAAVLNYRKSLEKNPANSNARDVLKKLEAAAY